MTSRKKESHTKGGPLGKPKKKEKLKASTDPEPSTKKKKSLSNAP